MLDSRGVCAFLRRQHAVNRSILAGRDALRPVLHPGARLGCVSPDYARSAALAPGNKLHVRDVFTGELLHKWDLPPVPAAFRAEVGWHWDAAGCVTLLYGTPWRSAWLVEEPPEQSFAGMVHVDVSTGSTAVTKVPLGELSSIWEPEACFWPGRSLLLVHHGSSWEGALHVFTIFDNQGTLLHSFGDLSNRYEPVWAPADKALLLRPSADCGAVQMLWDIDTAVLSSLSVDNQEVHSVFSLAWATPFFYRAAMLVPGERSAQAVLVAQAGQPVLTCAQGDYNGWHAVWGSRRVLPATDNPNVLHLLSFARGALALERTVRFGEGRQLAGVSLALSADGELCAAVTGTDHLWCHLAVIHVASGSLCEWPLHAPDLVSIPRARWSMDCTAVLVSAQDGSRNELFRIC